MAKREKSNAYVIIEGKKQYLTLNQEKFVFYLMEGDSQRVAYKKAYPDCKAEDYIVDVKASQLLATDKVGLWYEHCRNQLYNRMLVRAVVKSERAVKEIEKIAYNETYKPEGGKEEILIPLGMRFSAIKELKKSSDEIIKAQAEKDKGESDGKIDITVSVRNEN